LADRQNIIFVSVAYRLGAFGFAHNSEFMKEDGVMGNWAIHDQRLGMMWVNQYIHNVGGDPNQAHSFKSAHARDVLVEKFGPQN